MRWVRNKGRGFSSQPSKWHVTGELATMKRFVKWDRITGETTYEEVPYQWAREKFGWYADLPELQYSDTIPVSGGICGGCLKVWLGSH